jgi:hypothetical protein
MSSSTRGMNAGMFARSEGTAAIRLSVSIVRVVEKTLLNARATTVCCISPVCAMSIPPVERRWSTGVTDARAAIVAASMTEVEDGAKTAFSSLREAETITASMLSGTASSEASSVAAPSPATTTAVSAIFRKPTTENETRYSPGARRFSA